MATLTAWRFDTEDGADLAAARLVVDDAAVVVWPAGETRPRVRPLEASGPGGLDAGFWGLLFGVVFFVPLIGAAIGAATGAMAGSLADVGIDDHFINRLRDQVTPGTSALFLLASGAVVDLPGDPRVELIHTDLDPEQEAALRTVFGG